MRFRFQSRLSLSVVAATHADEIYGVKLPPSGTPVKPPDTYIAVRFSNLLRPHRRSPQSILHPGPLRRRFRPAVMGGRPVKSKARAPLYLPDKVICRIGTNPGNNRFKQPFRQLIYRQSLFVKKPSGASPFAV